MNDHALRLGAAVAVLICHSATPVGSGQGSVLERRLAPDLLGNPNVDIVVSQEQFTDTPAWRIAAMGRAPIGFEGVQDGQAREGTQRTRVDLTDSTVADALNAIVRVDNRYHWRMVGVVPVIRPISAWDDPSNALNRQVEGIAWTDITAEEALVRNDVILEGGSGWRPIPPGAPHDARLISVNVPAGSVVDVLNEVAHRHGEIMWSAVYENSRIRAGSRTLAIGFRWFDGHAIRSVRG